MTVRESTAQLGPVPEGLQGVIITDCSDPNAQVRQQVRFANLFGVTPTLVELGPDNKDLEAAGQLVDVLHDANNLPGSYTPKPWVVLVNVAPRGNDVKERWENGTPFCHFQSHNATVLSTYEGRSLSLARKLGLAARVNLMDIPTVTSSWVDRGIIASAEADAINNTQFRSKDFLSLAARELVGGRPLPATVVDLEDRDPDTGVVWFIDSFGNCKTTLLPSDIDFEEGKVVALDGDEKATCYSRLPDVPTGELALTIGSSGYGAQRLIELVEQQGRASDVLSLSVGSRVLRAARG